METKILDFMRVKSRGELCATIGGRKHNKEVRIYRKADVRKIENEDWALFSIGPQYSAGVVDGARFISDTEIDHPFCASEDVWFDELISFARELDDAAEFGKGDWSNFKRRHEIMKAI